MARTPGGSTDDGDQQNLSKSKTPPLDQKPTLRNVFNSSQRRITRTIYRRRTWKFQTNPMSAIQSTSANGKQGLITNVGTTEISKWGTKKTKFNRPDSPEPKEKRPTRKAFVLQAADHHLLKRDNLIAISTPSCTLMYNQQNNKCKEDLKSFYHVYKSNRSRAFGRRNILVYFPIASQHCKLPLTASSP